MVSDASKKAQKKWLKNPDNKKKHNEWCLAGYYRRRFKEFEKHTANLMEIHDQEDFTIYLMTHFNLKKNKE